jgi:hypothetical protein
VQFGLNWRPGFGLGSVGEGGSVGAAKIRCVSSPYSRRIDLLAVLKIRVSMVRFRPWPPLPTETQRVPGIARGLSVGIDGRSADR